MKKLLLVLVFALMASAMHAQYRTYKNQYDLKEYKYQKTDRYNPIGIAFMAVMLPGLGHVVIDEPLRGLGFCALTEGSFLMAMLSLYPMNENSNPTLRKILAISGATLCLSSYIWSIADVTRVARIKNMAFRDKKLAIHLYPSLQSYTNENALRTFNGGAALRINF